MRCPGLHPLVCWHHWARGGRHLARAQAPILLDGLFCTMTFPHCPMGSSPVSVAELPAQCTYLWRTEEHLFAKETSHHLGLLFLKGTTWIQSSGEPPQPLSTDFCAAASPLPTYFFPSCSQSESSATARSYVTARGAWVKRLIWTACHHLFSHMPIRGWQSSLHQGILAPGSFCLWGHTSVHRAKGLVWTL